MREREISEAVISINYGNVNKATIVLLTCYPSPNIINMYVEIERQLGINVIGIL